MHGLKRDNRNSRVIRGCDLSTVALLWLVGWLVYLFANNLSSWLQGYRVGRHVGLFSSEALKRWCGVVPTGSFLDVRAVPCFQCIGKDASGHAKADGRGDIVLYFVLYVERSRELSGTVRSTAF